MPSVTTEDLISRYGATCITWWRRVTHPDKVRADLEEISSTHDSVPELKLKARRLAEEALQHGKTVSRILSSRHRWLLVAAPVPVWSDYAITALFPFNRKSDLGNAPDQKVIVQLRTRDVALAAAQWALNHHPPRQASHLSASSHSGSECLDNLRWSTHSESPAWTELGYGLWLRLRRVPVDCLRNFRSRVMTTVGFLLVAIAPWPYAVHCKVTCEPAVRRFVATPFDCRLLETSVSAGDAVDEGQVLAMLDGSDLRSEIAGLTAKLNQAVQRRSAALATGDASKAELERWELLQLRGEIEILESRQLHLEIRSPISGVVVSGDLERVEGTTLSKGEKLFEIAPLESLVAEVAIPEEDISHVQLGMPARISLDAGHGRSQVSTLVRIHPRNEMRDGQSVFIAEVSVDKSDDLIRPGMNGKARVAVGWKPLAWVCFHRSYETLRKLIGW